MAASAFQQKDRPLQPRAGVWGLLGQRGLHFLGLGGFPQMPLIPISPHGQNRESRVGAGQWGLHDPCCSVLSCRRLQGAEAG